MFCSKCGAMIPDNAAFCASCGTKTEEAAYTAAPAYQMPAYAAPAPQKDKKKFYAGLIIGGCVAVILIVVLCLKFLGGNSYEDPIDGFFKGTFQGDIKRVFSVIPDEYKKIMYERWECDERTMLEEMGDYLDEYLERLDNVYGDWKFEYSVLETTSITGKELLELQRNYVRQDMPIDIDEAMQASVNIQLSGDDVIEEDEVSVVLIKSGGTWYLDPMTTRIFSEIY